MEDQIEQMIERIEERQTIVIDSTRYYLKQKKEQDTCTRVIFRDDEGLEHHLDFGYEDGDYSFDEVYFDDDRISVSAIRV